jgi:hypothetical protein
MAAPVSAADSDAGSSTCFICLGTAHSPDSSQEGLALLHGGCGCHGGLMGFGHVACIVKAAQETNTHMWQSCPTCNQVWTGQMALGLARARAGAVLLASSWPDSLPEDDEDLNSDRLQASRKLSSVLQDIGECAEALAHSAATLTTARPASWEEDAVTLKAMGELTTWLRKAAECTAAEAQAELKAAESDLAQVKADLAQPKADLA